jgi:hypothetical protein
MNIWQQFSHELIVPEGSDSIHYFSFPPSGKGMSAILKYWD